MEHLIRTIQSAALSGLILVVLGGCAQLEGLRARPAPIEFKQASEALKERDTARAASIFDVAVKKYRDDPIVYQRIFEMCRQSEEFAMGAKYASRGAETIPKDQRIWRAQLYMDAGECYKQMSDLSKSVAMYRQAYEVAPNEPQTLNGLGYLYAEMGENLDQAVQLTTQALKLAKEQGKSDEEIGAITDSIGWAYYKQRNLKDAINTLAAAAELAPRQWEVQLHLARAYLDASRLDDARVCLNRARAAAPRDRKMDDYANQLERELNAKAKPSSTMP